MLRKCCSGFLIFVGLAVAQPVAADAGTTFNITPDGVAIGGWDTVAYFTQNRAVEGSLQDGVHQVAVGEVG